jgi:hypothetical protein
MEDQCEFCLSTIESSAGRVEVNINKAHVFCLLCWDYVQLRWFRRMQKHVPLQSLSTVLAPYIVKDIPTIPSPDMV